jgi:ERCC4-type nuclease
MISKTINQKPILEIFSKKRAKTKEVPPQTILVDHRENKSRVPEELKKLNLNIQFKELKVGDYQVRNTIIERKTQQDFLSSMINKRLLRQIQDLSKLQKKLLIIEGDENLENLNNGINPNAIRGFLLSITLKNKIPIIQTKSPKETAKFLQLIANKKEKEISLKPKRSNLDEKQQLEFIIEGFPGIGPKTSKKLLQELGTIQNIINAPEDNLKKILGKKSENFLELIGRKYNKK